MPVRDLLDVDFYVYPSPQNRCDLFAFLSEREREVRLTHERMGVFPEHYDEGLGTTFLLSARDQSFLHA